MTPTPQLRIQSADEYDAATRPILEADRGWGGLRLWFFDHFHYPRARYAPVQDAVLVREGSRAQLDARVMAHEWGHAVGYAHPPTPLGQLEAGTYEHPRQLPRRRGSFASCE